MRADPETNKKAGVFTSHPAIRKPCSAECIFHTPANFFSSCANGSPITIPTHLDIWVRGPAGRAWRSSISFQNEVLQTQ
jgi:hypothetical protein